MVTLCKAITNRDWKVTSLILSSSRITDAGLKNLSTALTQSEVYSLTLYDSGLQSQGLEHLCEAPFSSECNLTSLGKVHLLLGGGGGWVGVFKKFFAKKIVALPFPRMD